MRRILKSVLVIAAFVSTLASVAQEYVTIDMEIDINKPAAEVWEKVAMAAWDQCAHFWVAA